MNWLLPPLPLKFEAALRDVRAVRPESRTAAAERLGRAEEAQRDAALSGLAELARDPHPGVRATAIAAIGLLGDEAQVDLLIAALGDAAAEVREFAALALAQIGGARAVAALRRELANGSPEVRFQAVAGVAELAPEEASAWLVPLLSDSDTEVRTQVVRALGGLEEPHLVGHLAGALGDSSEEVRLEAALALAAYRDRRAEPPLLAALAQGRRVAEAARALGQLGCERAADPIAALAGGLLVAPQLRAELGAALVELGDPRGTIALRRVLRGLRSDARGYAVELACEVGADGVVGDLVRLLDRPRGVDQLTIIEALRRFAPRSSEAKEALEQAQKRPDALGEAARKVLSLAGERRFEP